MHYINHRFRFHYISFVHSFRIVCDVYHMLALFCFGSFNCFCWLKSTVKRIFQPKTKEQQQKNIYDRTWMFCVKYKHILLSICFSSSGKIKWMALLVSVNIPFQIGSSFFLLYFTIHLQWHTDLCGPIVSANLHSMNVSALYTSWNWFHTVSLVQIDNPIDNLTLRFCVTVGRMIWKHITMLHQNW